MNDISNILWHIIYGKIININNKLVVKSITRKSNAEIKDYYECSIIDFDVRKKGLKKEYIILIDVKSKNKDINGFWHLKHYKKNKWNVIYDDNNLSSTTYEIKFKEFNKLYNFCSIALDNN
jgi:hypothetical protein